MAGFETIVRPVVFPNIRPSRAQSAAPQSDPTKGMCVIGGSGGSVIDLPYSMNINISNTRQVETKRKVDKARVYQKDEDGTVNKDTHVDVEVLKRVWTDAWGETFTGDYAPGDVVKGTEIVPGVGAEERVFTYAPVKEGDNIEIIDRDITKRPSE